MYKRIKDGKMVSTAEVQPHFFIFAFFKNGLHIGPCRIFWNNEDMGITRIC